MLTAIKRPYIGSLPFEIVSGREEENYGRTLGTKIFTLSNFTTGTRVAVRHWSRSLCRAVWHSWRARAAAVAHTRVSLGALAARRRQVTSHFILAV